MLARAESEHLFAHHDHAGFKTIVAGPHVLKSLDRTVKVGKEFFMRHPYPTWIVQTDSADFFLEHFSDSEPGYEESPSQLVRKVKDADGNYASEDVLFQFERRNSTKTGRYEYHLVTGLDVSGIDLPDDVEKPSPGFLGRIWVRNDKLIWRYMAGMITGHEAYVVPEGTVDSSVEKFLTQQIFPEPPVDSNTAMEFTIFANQAA